MKNLLLRLFESKVGTDKVLIVLGAVGWLVSMFAQLTAIKTNKSISDDKKKFLLNQETADGLTNTGLYLGLTTVFSTAVKKMLDKGKILTETLNKLKDEAYKKTGKTMRQLMQETDSNGNKPKNINEVFKNLNLFKGAENFEKHTFSEELNGLEKLEKTKGLDILQSVRKSELDEIIKLCNKYEHFDHMRTGLGMVATIAASVLSCNIITPIVRNKISNHMQEKYNMKPKAANPINPSINKIITPTTPRAFASFSSITKI